MNSAPGAGPVLLYDGTCGFCAQSVQFVLAHEREHTLRFAALDGEFALRVLKEHPQVHGMDSVVWVEPSDVHGTKLLLTRSDAAIRVAWYIGGPWRAFEVARIVPRPIRDAVYRLIARHRHRIAGTRCFVPGETERGRFLS